MKVIAVNAGQVAVEVVYGSRISKGPFIISLVEHEWYDAEDMYKDLTAYEKEQAEKKVMGGDSAQVIKDEIGEVSGTSPNEKTDKGKDGPWATSYKV